MLCREPGNIRESASAACAGKTRLADDLSALSLAEEHRLDLDPADADLADLAQRAASKLGLQFSDNDGTLRVDAGRDRACLMRQDAPRR